MLPYPVLPCSLKFKEKYLLLFAIRLFCFIHTAMLLSYTGEQCFFFFSTCPRCKSIQCLHLYFTPMLSDLWNNFALLTPNLLLLLLFLFVCFEGVVAFFLWLVVVLFVRLFFRGWGRDGGGFFVCFCLFLFVFKFHFLAVITSSPTSPKFLLWRVYPFNSVWNLSTKDYFSFCSSIGFPDNVFSLFI